MKIKLSLIVLAFIATSGFVSAQNTPEKTKEVKKEKTHCTDASQKATEDQKDAKTCKCDGVKELNGKVVEKSKECTGTCDQKHKKSTSCCDKKDQKSTSCCDKKDQKSTSCCDKKDQKSTSCCDKKDQKCADKNDKKVEKKASCCEDGKAAEVKPATENCSECEKVTTAPAKVIKK